MQVTGEKAATLSMYAHGLSVGEVSSPGRVGQFAGLSSNSAVLKGSTGSSAAGGLERERAGLGPVRLEKKARAENALRCSSLEAGAVGMFPRCDCPLFA